MRVVVLGGAAALAIAAGGGAWWWLSAPRPAEIAVSPVAVDIARGQSLYGANCSSCHGANLEGQPDWRSPGADGLLPAPPHDETGHTWHHTDSMLFSYVKLGGKELLKRQGMEFDSGMPEFGSTLADQDIWDILAFIKSTWPEREQKTQADRTRQELDNG